MNKYEQNLDKNKANFVPLTPLSFLERVKDIYPNYEALIYEDKNLPGKKSIKGALNLQVLSKKLELARETQFQLWRSIPPKFLRPIILSQ